MTHFPSNTALIVIDVQVGFDDPSWGERNNPQAEGNIATLLEAWRTRSMPIYHVQHISNMPDSVLRDGAAGVALTALAAPRGSEPLVVKHVNSAFIGTDLERRLRSAGIGSVVIVGFTTDHCVSTTTRMAGNLGFETFVVADATATFARLNFDGKRWSAADMHDVAIASLNGEFATALDTTNVLEALRAMDATSPRS